MRDHLLSALFLALFVLSSCFKDTEGIETTRYFNPAAQPKYSGSYVDLGLSVKWAFCNLGASNPEEYGGYYQWAGTQDVSSTGIYLDWDNCPYHIGNYEETGWTKYIPSDNSPYWGGFGSPDGKTVLDLDDDVAHIKLGGNWRMPTEAEWKELKTYCTWTWTTQNRVNGYKVTGKKPGYTDKSIFLPAAGRRYYGSLNGVSTYGEYWSSSLITSYPGNAFDVSLDSDGVYDSGYSRYYGLSVRPVYGDLVSVSGVSLSKTSLSLGDNGTFILNATVAPLDASNKKVTWSSSDASVVTVDANGKVSAVNAGKATVTATTSDGGFTAKCDVTVVSTEYVDLGLSVKWASFNVGASKPEDYGNYYAWGEIEEKTVYNWSTYKWCNGTFESMTKYNAVAAYGLVDNRAMLDPEDDVASVLLGDKWRMPSSAEVVELMANCILEECQINGVFGCKFTSKISGYSDKWIFLPAAGYFGSAGPEFVGVYCDIWSSSYVSYSPRYAYSAHLQDHIIDVDNRYWGYPIRAVYGDRIPVSGVRMNIDSISLGIGEIFFLRATITPSNATERNLIWSSSDESVVTVVEYSGEVNAVKEGTAIITVKTVDGGYIASCLVSVQQSHEYVDLGLSVKWSTCNVGASTPEKYGEYYLWAGTRDVSSMDICLDWGGCPYHSGLDGSIGWTKYIPSDKSSYWSGPGSPDGKTVLDLDDDVAHIKWGGNWRMPTEAEWKELKTNCTWTWTTQNGVNGYKVTGRKTGYTGRSIFLPAAGYRELGGLIDAGVYGDYWSSSLYTVYPDYAYYISFGSELLGLFCYNRSNGYSVRPVTE